MEFQLSDNLVELNKDLIWLNKMQCRLKQKIDQYQKVNGFDFKLVNINETSIFILIINKKIETKIYKRVNIGF